MGSAIGESLVLVINTLGGLFILAVLLRFLLQATGADFYNPVSQAIVKATNPAIKPLRKIIPSYRNLDFGPLILAILLNIAATSTMILAAGLDLPGVGSIISWAVVGILSFILKIYFFTLIISIIASWIAPFSGNPALMLASQIIEPLQSLFRKVIPPMGGLDFSPIFIFLGIQIIENTVIGTLAQALGMNPRVFQFVIGI